MSLIAIDPGLSGGLAYQNVNGVISCEPMPRTEGDLSFCLSLKKGWGAKIVAYVEEVGGYHGTPMGNAMFKLGRNFGFLLGCLQTLGIRVELVRPQKWQKALGLHRSKTMSKTQWKNKLKAEAQRLFPDQKVTLKTADALLILEYARRVCNERASDD